MDKLSKNEQIMSELIKELLEHNNSLFNHSNALKSISGFPFSNKQNEDYLSKLGELASRCISCQQELTSVVNKLKLTFKGIEKSNRKKKQQSQRKNAKKCKQRKLERNLRTMKHTFSLIFPQSSFEEFKPCDAERQLQSLNVERIAELKQIKLLKGLIFFVSEGIIHNNVFCAIKGHISQDIQLKLTAVEKKLLGSG